ncbi:MAG: hypothetical protein QM526_00005 [Alphaproteobacteria bacterium]|nr:hypothetical protein [Alphaproteobacteria bacterium]
MVEKFSNSLNNNEGTNFETLKAKKPLKEEDIEKEIISFFDKNLEILLPIFIRLDRWSNIDSSEIIKKLKITDEHVRLLGADYRIKITLGGRHVIHDGSTGSIVHLLDINDFLALAYAHAHIRVDSRKQDDKISNNIPHRYYLKSHKRYLCANDFGIRFWSDEQRKMIDGDPTNASGYVEALKLQIERILENIGILANYLYEDTRNEAKKELTSENGTQFIINNKRDDSVLEERTLNMLSKKIITILSTNKKDKELVFTSIPRFTMDDLSYFDFYKIAEKYGFISDDPFNDYKNFYPHRHKLQWLFSIPTEQEKNESTLKYIYSNFHQKPMIITSFSYTDIRLGGAYLPSVINSISHDVHEILAHRAIENETEEVKKCFEKYRWNEWNEGSDIFYFDYELYDLIKHIGTKDIEKVLDPKGSDVRRILKDINKH